MDAELVGYIGALWKPLAVVGLTVVAVIERKPLGSLIARISHVSIRRTADGHDVILDTPHLPLLPPVPSPVEPLIADNPGEEDLAGEVDTNDAPEDVADLKRRMLDAISCKDLDGLRETYLAFSHDALTADESRELAANYEFMQFLLGDGTALIRLQAMASTDDGGDVMSTLGFAYESAKDYSAAAVAFHASASLSTDEDEKATRLARAFSAQYTATGEAAAALDAARAAEQFLSIGAKRRLLETAAKLYKRAGSTEMEALMLELALQHAPGDSDLLFSTAYAYSQAGHTALAVMHYSTELHLHPNNDMAVNNLGAAYSALECKLEAVRMFKQALSNGNTLASANLAYQYIDAGLESEARETLSIALGTPDPHENVAHALSHLERTVNAEADNRKTIQTRALRTREFMRSYAEAFLSESTSEWLEGLWTGIPTAALRMQVDGSKVLGEHQFTENTRYRVSGQTHGRSAKVEVSKGQKSSWSDSWNYAHHSDLMLCCDDAGQVRALVTKGTPPHDVFLMESVD